MVPEHNSQLSSSNIKFKINHPKLVNTLYSFPRHMPFDQFQRNLTHDNLLCLFRNFYFEVHGVPLRTKNDYQLLITSKVDTVELSITFEHYKYTSAMHHFQTLKNLLKNPLNLCSIIKPMSKESLDSKDIQIEDIISQLVPESFRGCKWSIDNVIASSYRSELWQTRKRQNNQLVHLFELSGFNPPPPQAEFNGDLFYIHLKTLQHSDLHITASPLGFYLNQSKINLFNPTIHNNKIIYSNLLDLLSAVSDKFSSSLAKNTEVCQNSIIQRLIQKNIYFFSQHQEKWKWLDNIQAEHQHHWNSQRDSSLRDHQNQGEVNRDWNQQFLSLERDVQLLRGKGEWVQAWKTQAYRHLYHQFAQAAVQGTKKIIDGRIQAINHIDQKRRHIYIHNKIFFSTTQQNPYDHSMTRGQDDAVPTDSSTNTDIINLEKILHFQPKGLRMLHTMLINYRGCKTLAQTIIPGLLSSQINSITQYGTLDDGKSVQANQQFREMLMPICQMLHLDDSVQAIVQDGNTVKIAVSPQIKGIKSVGGQNYLCDLQKFSPRDLNYQGPKNEGCVLRQKLLTQFIEENKIDFTVSPLINTNIGTQVKFQKGPRYEQQEAFLKEAAKYLRQTAILRLIASLKSKNPGDYLTDSFGISHIFHEHGVNMRYLGLVQKHGLLRESLEARICLKRVIFVRSLKHFFRAVLRKYDCSNLSVVLSNLLNCIFAKRQKLIQMCKQQPVRTEVAQKKKKKRKTKEEQKQIKNLMNEESKAIKAETSPYQLIKPNEVWQQIKKICKSRFDYNLEGSVIQFHEKGLFRLHYQKYAVLRDICLNLGLVLQMKDYFLYENNSDLKALPFCQQNILYFVPSPKTINIHYSKRISSLKCKADQQFAKNDYKEALKLYCQAVQQMRQRKEGQSIFSYCLGQISRIYYLQGKTREAIAVETENLVLSQRLGREDSLEVTRCYSRLGLYCMAIQAKQLSLWLLYKGLYLMLISFGEAYPDVMINFANIAKVHQTNKEGGMASSCYLKVIEILTEVYDGKNDIKISFCYSSLASLHYEFGEFRRSVEYQNQAVSILEKVLHDDDFRCVDAKKILKMYRDIFNSSRSLGSNQLIQHGSRDRKK